MGRISRQRQLAAIFPEKREGSKEGQMGGGRRRREKEEGEGEGEPHSPPILPAIKIYGGERAKKVAASLPSHRRSKTTANDDARDARNDADDDNNKTQDLQTGFIQMLTHSM